MPEKGAPSLSSCPRLRQQFGMSQTRWDAMLERFRVAAKEREPMNEVYFEQYARALFTFALERIGSSTTETPPLAIAEPEPGEVRARPALRDPARSAAAAILGRRGGRKGGPARAAKLTPERRKEIARRAAEARWRRTRE